MKYFWRLVTVLLILCVASYLWFYGIDAVRSVFFWLSLILTAAVGLYAFQRFPFADAGGLVYFSPVHLPFPTHRFSPNANDP